MADHWQACKRIIAEHSKSFDLASRLFPPARRREVAALYAWCRHCDDAIDLVPAEEHPRAMQSLRERLDAIYAGAPQTDPVSACFQEVALGHRIPIEYPLELLSGMEMDVDHAGYPRFDDLLVYCWRVAGTVGLMMCHVLGVSDPRAVRHAAHLGIAMQLTNIARDVDEDRRRGRIYLPLESMSSSLRDWMLRNADAASRPETTHSRPEDSSESFPEDRRAELARNVGQLLDHADRYYASADVGIGYLEPRSALAVRAARLVYAEIGEVLRRRRCDVTLGRVSVSSGRKLRLVGRAMRRYPGHRAGWSDRTLQPPSEILDGTQAIQLS